jgi:hypothetical protein
MPQTVQPGTILIEESPLTLGLFGLEIERYSGKWSMVKSLDGFGVDRKIRGAGWHFFFLAEEVKAIFFGATAAKKIQNALLRIFGKIQIKTKTRQHPFNALEITGIATKGFLGVRYTIVSAHSRHIQRSCYLDGTLGRPTSQNPASNRLRLERVLEFRSAES